MKVYALAAAATVLLTPVGWGYSGFWVIKDVRAEKCSIVTSNPVIDGPIGPVLWGSGPYRSEQDAKLAMSTIGACR